MPTLAHRILDILELESATINGEQGCFATCSYALRPVGPCLAAGYWLLLLRNNNGLCYIHLHSSLIRYAHSLPSFSWGANGGCGGKEAKPPAPPTASQRKQIYGKAAPEGQRFHMNDEAA